MNREKNRNYSEEKLKASLYLYSTEVAETAAQQLNPCDKPRTLLQLLAVSDEIAKEPDATAGNIILVFQMKLIQQMALHY